MSWTEKQLKDYITRSLGGDYRAVELHENAFKDALKRAVGKLSTKAGSIKKGSFNVVEGQQKYDFSSSGLDKAHGRGILDVTLEPLVSPSDVFSEAEYFRIRQPPYIEAGELVADRLYYKTLAIVTGSDFDWWWDQASETLMLTPSPTRTVTGAYTYISSFTDITEVPEGRQGWVVDYTFALCKQIVGRVRSKFGGDIPGNELSVSLDGADLITEGREDQEKLDESLKKVPYWNPPVRG